MKDSFGKDVPREDQVACTPKRCSNKLTAGFSGYRRLAVAVRNHAARVVRGRSPSAVLEPDGVDVHLTAVLALDQALGVAHALVVAPVVEHFTGFVRAVVVKTAVESSLHSCKHAIKIGL